MKSQQPLKREMKQRSSGGGGGGNQTEKKVSLNLFERHVLSCCFFRGVFNAKKSMKKISLL